MGLDGDMETPRREAIRVLLIEDSAVLAERLREMLQQMPGVDLVGMAGSEKEAVALLARTPADALILDLHLSQGNGFGVIGAMRTLGASAEVVILTNYTMPQYQRRAQALGVHYFLDKAREFDSISDVLQEIAGRRDRPRAN
jgi:DNA-binding NarL/FixJ family response regulator